jgi:DNA-binding HxlR family transcriptional regulator
MNEAAEHRPIGAAPDACQAREILDRVADKWSLFVLAALGDSELRFNDLKRSIDGISQRMLTVTLRGLERDGIVTRTIYSAMPPNIAYRLTPMGATLWTATAPLVDWANAHLGEIDAARRIYDALTFSADAQGHSGET